MSLMGYLRKAVLPIIWFALLIYIGKYICVVDGQIEWFRVMLLFGIPYGVPYMIFYAPGRWGISGGIGVLALEVIIGAMFGFVIAGVNFVRSWIYLLSVPLIYLISKR